MSSVLDQVAAAAIQWAGFNSRSITVANVTAGATIVVVNDQLNFGSGTLSVGASGVNDGSAYTLAGQSQGGSSGGYVTAEVWYLHNASAGSHNITVTSNVANSNNFGNIFAFSWIGLQTAAPDVVQTNHANSATLTSGASSAPSQSGELLVAALGVSTNLASPSWTHPATGFTQLFYDPLTSHGPSEADYQHITATTAQTSSWGTNSAGAEFFAACLIGFKDVIVGSNPTITSVVDGANPAGTIKQGDAGVVITGTNFGSNTGSAAVTLIDGSSPGLNSNGTITAWGSTSITFTVAGGNVRYGPATVKVTTSGGLTATFGVTFLPTTGTNYQTLNTLKALTTDVNGVPSRLTDSTDIGNGEQLEITTTGGSGTATVSPDGNMSWPTTLTQVTFRHHNGTVWSSSSHWDVRGIFPSAVLTIPTQTGTNGTALTWSLSPFFSESDAASLPLTYTISAGVLPTGLSINTSTGQVTGTPSVTGTVSGIVARATNADSSYAESQAFAATISSNANVVFTGPIPNTGTLIVNSSNLLPIDVSGYFANATSYAVTTGALPGGLTLTGSVINGIPNGSGITLGTTVAYPIVITGSGTASPANSNSFNVNVSNPSVSTTIVPDVSSSPTTEATAFSTITSANLIPAATIDWAGSVSITQSIVAGATVPQGTTVFLTPVGVSLSSFSGIALIKNGSTTTPGGGVSWMGGKGLWVAVGTFGGSTLNLQFLGPDGQTWVTLNSLGAPGQVEFDLSVCNIRTQVVGGPPSGIYSYVNRIPLG